MNGYQEETIYGVPYSTWASWSQDTKDRYLMQYNMPDPWETGDCFSHGDGRSTCYSNQSDAEILAYAYTYGTDEVINGEAVETGQKVNAFLDDPLGPIMPVVETGVIVAVLAAILLLSKGR